MGPEGLQGPEGPQGPPGESGVVSAGVATNDLSATGVPVLIDPTTGALGTASATGIYKPTVVTVSCDGSGTPLADALLRLNPAAAVYEIVISGTCNELITLKNFSSLTLRSADGSEASIGPVVVDNGNDMVLISGLSIKLDSAQPRYTAVQKVSVGRLELRDVSFVCDSTDGGICASYVVTLQGAGDLRLYGGWVSENWGTARVSLSRNATAIVSPTPAAACTPWSYLAQYASTIRIGDPYGTGFCSRTVTARSEMGSLIEYQGPDMFSKVEAYGGQVYGPSDHPWFTSLSCKGAAAVVESADFSGNQCP
jgi:hypothetical protein